MLTPQDHELCQEAILLQCHQANRFGLPEATILRGVQLRGYDEVKSKDLERDLRYLEDKGWIKQVSKDLRPDLRRWQTTSAGDEALMQRGLI